MIEQIKQVFIPI